MGTNYRAILRRRGVPDPPRGRPPLPAPVDQLADGWARATQAERAAFMVATGLRPDPDTDHTAAVLADLGISGRIDLDESATGGRPHDG
jgi:hypothetical protein